MLVSTTRDHRSTGEQGRLPDNRALAAKSRAVLNASQLRISERLISLGAEQSALLIAPPGWGKTRLGLMWASHLHDGRARLIAPRKLHQEWEAEAIGLRLTPLDARSHQQVRSAAAPERQIVPPEPTIIDEAHRFRNPQTKGYGRLAHAIAGAPRLLLTATPVWNRAEDLLSLLELILCEAESRWIVRSLLDEVIGFLKAEDRLLLIASSAAGSSLCYMESMTPKSFGRYSARAGVGIVSTRIEKRAIEPRLKNRMNKLAQLLAYRAGVSREWILSGMTQLALSSPAALKRSVAELELIEWQVRATGSGDSRATRHFWREQLIKSGFGPARMQLCLPGLGGSVSRETDPTDLSSSSSLSAPSADMETAISEALEGTLSQLATPDIRWTQQLDAFLTNTDWWSKPWVLFTRFRATAEALAYHWQTHGRDVALLTGGTSRWGARTLTPPQLLNRWRRSDAGVLIITSAGSEGLNLQRAHRLMLWDSVWSPAHRMQLIGRIWRQGQRASQVQVVEWQPAAQDQQIEQVAQAAERKARGELCRANDPRLLHLRRNPLIHRVEQEERRRARRTLARRLSAGLAVSSSDDSGAPDQPLALPERLAQLDSAK